MAILKNTKILFGVNLFITLSLFAPVEVLYLQSLHISSSIISILNLFVPIVMVFMDVPAGILADYLGRKKIVFLSILAFFGHMLILLFTTGTFELFLAYALEGIGWSLYSGNTDAIVVEDSLEKKKDIGVQLVYFYSGLSLGPVISGFLSSGLTFVGDSMNFKLALLLSVITRGIALLLIFFVHVTNDEITNNNRIPPKDLFVEGLKLIKKPFSLSVVIYEATGRLDFYMPVIFQPLAMRNGLSLVYFGLLYSIAQLLQYFVQKKADVIIKRIGIDRVMLFSPILLCVGLLMFIVPNLTCILIGFVITKVVGPLRNQCLAVKKNEFVENKVRATYLSLISSFVLIVNSAFLSFAGNFLDSYFSFSISFIAGICFVGSLFYRRISTFNAPQPTNQSVASN